MKMKSTAAIAALAAGLLAAPTSALALVVSVDLEETLSVTNVNLTANAESPSFAFDINGDQIDDFEVNIQFGDDLFETGDEIGLAITEFATIRALFDTPNLEAGVIVQGSQGIDVEQPLPIREQAVEIFGEGDLVGGNQSESFFSGLLYAEGVSTLDDSGTFSFGPFSEIWSRGFVGLFLVDQFENQNFGFAEITRGSITVGSVGFQTLNGAAAPIPVSAVPLPPAFGLLAGAIGLLGLYGRRRTAA